jgi:hypothetical protein
MPIQCKTRISIWYNCIEHHYIADLIPRTMIQKSYCFLRVSLDYHDTKHLIHHCIDPGVALCIEKLGGIFIKFEKLLLLSIFRDNKGYMYTWYVSLRWTHVSIESYAVMAVAYALILFLQGYGAFLLTNN